MAMESAPLVQKVHNLTVWVLKKVERFPRSYRFTVGDRITATMLDLQSSIVEAAFETAREEPLRRAQRQINTLRFLIRTAKDLHLLTADSYGYAAEKLDEAGRMTGGWRKSLPQGAR